MRMILNCIDRKPSKDGYWVIFILGLAMQFSQLKTGDKARIVGIRPGEVVYRQRLISMGLLPGTEFVVTRIAPLGDPVEISVRGFYLSLRKQEANILDIEKVPG